MRLLRLILFVIVAFVSCVLFERLEQREACETAGGQWLRAGYCGEMSR